ncbi:MAG: T9SS type A sorting domain-containing protein [Bacteroidetes bacterium]|nr:T9SS type A sorting domain-containing protein [Bacteroidota bacterium]
MKRLLLIFLLLPCVLRGQVISTYAGNGAAGYSGDGQQAVNASVGFTGALAVDRHGNLYVAEWNNTVRKVSVDGIITTIAGNGTQGFSGDNGPATLAAFHGIGHLAIDTSGNVFISDFYNNRIRKVDAGTGIITTIAGDGNGGYNGDNIQATTASLYSPNGLIFDTANNLYISDYGNRRIRKISPNGIIVTIGGNGALVDSGDGGPAVSAGIYTPQGLTLDHQGNLLIAESNRIRKIDLSTGIDQGTHIISTIAGGNDTFGFAGDGGSALSAKFSPAVDVVVGAYGYYITDQGNNRIRYVDSNDVIHTVTGNGIGGYNGDGGLADTSELNSPRGIALDNCGNLYIADNANYRVRKVIFNPNCALGVTMISEQENAIMLSPNPTQNELTITAGSNIKELAIINTMGQRVLSQKGNGMKQTVQTGGLSAGVYFVVLRDERGEVWRGRFVKE